MPSIATDETAVLNKDLRVTAYLCPGTKSSGASRRVNYLTRIECWRTGSPFEALACMLFELNF